MASDKFVKFSEADIKFFSEKQENSITKNKTSFNLKLFRGMRTHPRYKISRVFMGVENEIPMGHFRYIIGFYWLY